jgi:hypothetical protein
MRTRVARSLATSDKNRWVRSENLSEGGRAKVTLENSGPSGHTLSYNVRAAVGQSLACREIAQPNLSVRRQDQRGA